MRACPARQATHLEGRALTSPPLGGSAALDRNQRAASVDTAGSARPRRRRRKSAISPPPMRATAAPMPIVKTGAPLDGALVASGTSDVVPARPAAMLR